MYVYQMDLVVGKQFLHSSPAKRQRLLDTVRTYVTHPQFLAIVSKIDPHDSKGTQISHVCLQLGQFNSNAKLWDDVELWLRSESGFLEPFDFQKRIGPMQIHSDGSR